MGRISCNISVLNSALCIKTFRWTAYIALSKVLFLKQRSSVSKPPFRGLKRRSERPTWLNSTQLVDEFFEILNIQLSWFELELSWVGLYRVIIAPDPTQLAEKEMTVVVTQFLVSAQLFHLCFTYDIHLISRHITLRKITSTEQRVINDRPNLFVCMMSAQFKS